MDVTRREALKIAGGGVLAACLPGASSIQPDPATEAVLVEEWRSFTELWRWLFSAASIGMPYVEAQKRLCAEVRDLPNHAEAVRMYSKAVTHGVTTFVMGGCAAAHRGKIRARPPELTRFQAERIYQMIWAGLRSKLAFSKPPLLPSVPLHEGNVEAALRSELETLESAVKEAKARQHGVLDEEQLSQYRWDLQGINAKLRNVQDLSTSLTDLLDECYEMGYQARHRKNSPPRRWGNKSSFPSYFAEVRYWEQVSVLVDNPESGVAIVRYRVTAEEANTYARQHGYDHEILPFAAPGS